MKRFKAFLLATILFSCLILIVQIGETGEDRDDDGSLTAKVESKRSGPRIKSKARASSGSDIVDGIYDVYAQVGSAVDEYYNSYSGSIYKLARENGPNNHNINGRADSMIDGFDNIGVLFVAIAHTTT